MAGDPGTLPAQAQAATPGPAAGVAPEQPIAIGDDVAANSESCGWGCWAWRKTKCGMRLVNGFKTFIAFGAAGLTFLLDIFDQMDIKGMLASLGVDEKQVAIVGLAVVLLGIGMRLVSHGPAFSGSGKPSVKGGVDYPEEENE